MKAKILGLLAVGLLAGPMTAARATIAVTTGNTPGGDTVFLNNATDVLTVTGTVGLYNQVVNFTSSSGSGLLDANSVGATISGGTGNEAFTELTLGLASNDFFTHAVFNINAATDGSVNFFATDDLGNVFQTTFFVDADAQNFFTFTAIDGQFIDYISLNGVFGATFEDLRQVRLATGVPTVVPEPGSLALLGLGVAGLGLGRRRKAG